jgi:hypothetical protein
LQIIVPLEYTAEKGPDGGEEGMQCPGAQLNSCVIASALQRCRTEIRLYGGEAGMIRATRSPLRGRRRVATTLSRTSGARLEPVGPHQSLPTPQI